MTIEWDLGGEEQALTFEGGIHVRDERRRESIMGYGVQKRKATMVGESAPSEADEVSTLLFNLPTPVS
jgi:hypothetical protein